MVDLQKETSTPCVDYVDIPNSCFRALMCALGMGKNQFVQRVTITIRR